MGAFDFTRPATGGRGVTAPAPAPERMRTPDLDSNYDLDYGYVARYDRDMKNYGKILPETAKLINKEIRQTNVNMNFRGIGFDASAVAADYAAWQHDFVLEQENINPNDGIPAYAEQMMYKGPEGTATQYKAQGQDMKNEFYNTVYYCKDVLTDVTKRVLGDDYERYAAGRDAVSAGKSRSAQAANPNGPAGLPNRGQDTFVRREYDAGIPMPAGSDDQYSF